MIDQMDNYISAWVEEIIPDATVVFTDPTPGKLPDNNTVFVRLLTATPTLPPRDTRQPTIQIALQYLIAVHHDNPIVAHRSLSVLIFHAMQNEVFSVDIEPIPITIWALLNQPVRPALRIMADVRQPLPTSNAHLVLHPMRVNLGTMRAVYGHVRGSMGQAIQRASISCPALGLYTYSDQNGRFQLPLVPGQDTDLHLVVKVKEKVYQVTVNQPTSYESPLIITVTPNTSNSTISISSSQ